MAKSGKGSSRLDSSLQLGANIENLRYKNKAALPNQHENDAQLFADIGKSFSAPGDRPRGVLSNLGAGIAKGLEYGAKSHAIGERRDDYEEHANVMNYFQDVNDAAIEQNQWYETREKARTEMMPQVLSYMDNIARLDPQSQRIMAQDMLAQYGEAIGENFKLSSIDGSNPFLMTIQSDKGQQLFDLRSMFAGDEAIQQSIAMKMPEYQLKLQQERQDKQRKFDLMKDELEIKKYKEGIPSGKYGTRGGGMDGESTVNIGGQDYESIPLDSLEKSAKADYQKKVSASLAQVPINNQAIETIQGMKDIFKKHEDIGSSLIHLLDTEDMNSWGNIIARKFTSQEKLAAMEKLKKMASDLNLSTILGVPGKSATDLLKQEIKKAAPHGILTKEGFDDIANKWEKRAYERNQFATAQAKGIREGRMIIPASLTPQGMQAAQPSAGGGNIEESNDNTDLSDMGVRVG